MDGRYIYCITDGRQNISLGNIGIEKAEVYTIPFCSLLAVVHNCEAKAYIHDDINKSAYRASEQSRPRRDEGEE